MLRGSRGAGNHAQRQPCQEQHQPHVETSQHGDDGQKNDHETRDDAPHAAGSLTAGVPFERKSKGLYYMPGITAARVCEGPMSRRAWGLLSLLTMLIAGCGSKAPYEGKSVAQLERMLRDSNTTVQAQGAMGLAELGPPARSA